jgi:hypothetical protein
MIDDCEAAELGSITAAIGRYQGPSAMSKLQAYHHW